MGIWLFGYLVTASAFLGCDAVWLSITASRLYRPKLQSLIRDDFAVAPAAIFYLLYVVGILVFAVAPALSGGRWATALWRGALLGLVAYATYDLTNQATMRGWSSTVTVVDLCWGMIVTSIASTAGFIAMRWIAGRG